MRTFKALTGKMGKDDLVKNGKLFTMEHHFLRQLVKEKGIKGGKE